MRARYLVLGVVLVLAAVTGVLIYRGNATTEAGQSGPVTVTQTSYASAPGTTSSATTSSGAAAPTETGAGASGSVNSSGLEPSTGGSTIGTALDSATNEASSSAAAPAADPGRKPTNVPMTKLKPGEKAPQFVIFSFDGAGSHEKWHEFMDAAEPTDSRFTGFLTGIYLLDTDHRDAYTGPGHSPGKASVGFGGKKDDVITEVKDLNEAYANGHEIGTHYNGHFCVGAEPSGATWTTANWSSELDQFFDFMTNWKTINGYPDAPDLTVPTSAVKGGRTPCLEGKWDQMVPAWKAHNMTYDTSIPAPYTGIAWPKQEDGIWEFHMPTVYSPGFQGMVMAMDYNFWYKFNQAKDQPETAPKLRGIVKATYDFMYQQAYDGNRAPILIANHFNNWNGNSFNGPALDFMKDACGKKDTYCATYTDVIDWMELQDPAVLAALQEQLPVAASASG